MANRQWNGVTDGGNRSQKRLSALLKYIDVRIIYCFLPFVVCYYLIAARRRAGAIYNYLRKRQGFTKFKAAVGTYRNHILFGRNLLDRFYVFAGKRGRYTISEKDRNLVKGYFEKNMPLIMLSAHVGNYEMASYLCGELPKRLNVLAFAHETEQMQSFRSDAMRQNNIQIIPVMEDMSHLFEIAAQMEQGNAITLAADRYYMGKRSAEYSFLGEAAIFPTGSYYLADKYNAQVIALFILRAKKNFSYDVVVEPITIDNTIVGREARALAYGMEYVRVLENVVKRYPLQWFNFYDFWSIGEGAANKVNG